jgi:hypothetical protein
MFDKETTEWVRSVPNNAKRFLADMRDGRRPGFYRYSFSGDYYGSNINWGLANTVFAAKIYYMLGGPDANERAVLATRIAEFQKSSGYIYDAFLYRRILLGRLVDTVKTRRISTLAGLLNEDAQRAETRQALAALIMLDERPDKLIQAKVRGRAAIKRFFDTLDWSNPWAAASQFGHVLFFLHLSQLFDDAEKTAQLEFGVGLLSSVQSSDDGCWHVGPVTPQLSVNGAMKVIVSLDLLKRLDTLRYPERIIDTCLATLNDQEACSQLNVVYVLAKCTQLTDHRRFEIEDYFINKLESFRTQYYPDRGGFSFRKGASGLGYFGARIARGLDEPDIHGTYMLIWGITLISTVLGLNLGLREPVN